MQCYYERLSIARDAEDKEIKNAYRKLALRYHPDKNLDNAEEAKERFQLIQQAYEVLSDPQERAFYDKHREQILRGKNSNYEDNTLDLFQYFTVSCYKGYGDDLKGFYSVYREVFQKIAAEDAEFMDEGDEDIPEFGDSQSEYENVVGSFYAYWQSYCTKKTYTWLCPYDIQEIKDRRVLRAIDKEMKKIVQNARRERNDEVRSLVAFVRKRDKRVQAYNQKLEERAALNRKKQEENRRKQMLQRQREVEEMRSKQNDDMCSKDYEEQLKQLAQEYEEDSDDSLTDDEDCVSGEDEEERELEYADEFFCVACSKAFKNQNAFDNHALSKKHRENEERLKLEMLEEEDAFNSMNLNDNDAHDYTSDEATTPATLLENSEENDEEEPIPKIAVASARKKKSKKSKKNISKLVEEWDDDNIKTDFTLPEERAESSNDDWSSGNKKNNRKNQNKKHTRNTEKDRPCQNEIKNVESNQSELEEAEAVSSTKHTCVTCNATFESKNKLFAHLKKTNHGVPKTNVISTDSTRPKLKGKRK